MGSKSNSKATKGTKQNVTKANGGKLQSQESQIENEANGDPHTDCSMLRKPIDISVSGVGQVVKVYQTGTTEVRQLLAYECDLVYECKVCRNLFRSLANFVSHKRVYCREQFSDTKHVLPAHHVVEDSTTVIQPEPVPPGTTETWVTNDASPDPIGDDSDDRSALHIETSVPPIATYSKPKRDLSHIIERLSQKSEIKSVAETGGHISASKFYETVSEDIAAQRGTRKEHVICLEGTENTKFGVFQTVLPSNSPVQMENVDLMKAQVVELHNMMSANEATLGPDGRIEKLNIEGTTLASIQNTGGSGAVVRKKDSAQNNKTGSSKENHVCSICNTIFSTRKTLNHHMKSLHVTFRMCYPCPCCKNTFCNTWSVYRHLYKVHRKTTIQVRKLRSQIVNKAFRKEVSDYESQNSNVKSTGIAVQSEADKARTEQQRLHQETQAWMNNFEDDLELQMCGGCGRRFERRAALNSHSQICQKRIAVQNNIKTYRPSTSTSTATSNRIASTKVLPVSTDRQHLSRTETTKNDITFVESNTSRLTLLSGLSESMQSTTSGTKSVTTPSSPVSLDISNQLLATAPSASYHRTRHCSGSWSDTIKKDIPEKRIEIQIRRDYCKTGTGAGIMSSVLGVGGPSSQQQDDNSETNENALSYDDTEDGDDHDEVSNISNEDCEDHGELYQPTEPSTCFSEKDPHQSYGKLDGSIGINVCSFTETIEKEATKREKQTIDASLIDIVPSVRNVKDDESSTHSLQDTDFHSNSNQSEENTDVTDKKKQTNFMRYIDKQSTSVSQVCDRGLGQDTAGYASEGEVNELQDERRNTLDEKGNESVPVANTKKEDQFSPIMENRMQSMINIRRLQCLPCQKKFNKLTNLRRHVAVHIGWNRYQCTECKFRCFSKYDCVAHVTKMHLGKAEHDKAQTMVEYIETQISDSENALSKYEPTEEPYRSQNNENGQHMVQDTNIKMNNKYSPALEDVEITVNDTDCNKICDWSLEEYDESKTIITGTSDCATGIEAVPNNIKSSMIKLKDVEEHLYEYAVEGERAENAVMHIPVKQGPMITVGDPNSCVTTVKVKSGNLSAPVANDSAAILQEEERRKYTTSSSSSGVRLNRYVMNTEGLEHEEPESTPSKKRLTTTEYEQNIRNAIAVDFEQNDCKPKILNVVSETNVQNDPTPPPAKDDVLQVQNPSETKVQEQTALRKMVLEVIFGSGSNVSHDLDATHSMLSMGVNGEHHHSEGSASSPEPYDVVESVSCDSTSPLTSNSSAASPVLTSEDAGLLVEETSSVVGERKSDRQDKLRNSVSPVLETERRQRPVRNRIKVEREDFIYDLSDRCLDPRRDGDDRKVTKRKQEDRIPDSVKVVLEKGNCSAESSYAKVIPKVVLVRTNIGEYSGLRVVNKTGSANNMTQVFDSSSDKHNSPNSVGYNISTRKSQRTYDISPRKIPTVSQEKHE